MSEQQKQQEERKVSDRPQTNQNDNKGPRNNNQDGERKPYKKFNKDNAPSKKDILGENLRKPKKDDGYIRKPRVEREDLSKLVITLETEIPELPKKNQKVQKPDDEAHLKQVEKVTEQIDQQYDNISKYVEDLRTQIKKNQTSGKTNKEPLRDNLKAKQDEKKKLYETYNAVKVKFDALKEQLETATNQAATYRQKMKSNLSKDDLQREINELQDQYKHGSNSIAEEKVIIKRIAELQKSLPYADPLEQLNQQIKKLKAEKDVVNKSLREQQEQIKTLKADIQEQFDTLTNLKQEKDKNYIDIKPLAEAKKNEIKPIIESLRQKKRDLKDQHFQAWEEFYKQEELVRKVEFIKKKKAYLQKKHLQEQEALAAEEKKKEEQSQFNENPYKEEISLCQLLQDYCQGLLPKQVVQTQQVEKNFDLQATLKTDEWKKEKVTEISTRRDEELDEFALVGKKNNKNKKQQQRPVQQQQSEKTVEVLLNHQIEILQYFEQLSIPAPLLQKQLEETVKQLAAKKQYFEELPTDDTTGGYIKPSTKDEEDENKQKQDQEKKQRKQKRVETFNANDEEFPDMK